jgi:plasmid stability protein
MRRRRFSRAAASAPAISCALAILCGCSLMPSAPQRAPSAPTPSADPSLGQMSSYLDMMERLSRATPAEQAEIVQNAKDAAELTPTTSNRLRYALALATPGHGKTDEDAARQMLTQLLATPETMLPAERALAWISLKDVDLRLILQAENQRLQAATTQQDRDRTAATNRRLQAEIEENARLRKQLAEAQAKLDEITRIERAIIERNPGNGGH